MHSHKAGYYRGAIMGTAGKSGPSRRRRLALMLLQGGEMPKKLSNALTPLAVKNANPGGHADGAGLHLLVKPSGARSWVYRFMVKGKSRDVGLGAAGPGGMSLADGGATDQGQGWP
jgi:hypothetical protein